MKMTVSQILEKNLKNLHKKMVKATSEWEKNSIYRQALTHINLLNGFTEKELGKEDYDQLCKVKEFYTNIFNECVQGA